MVILVIYSFICESTVLLRVLSGVGVDDECFLPGGVVRDGDVRYSGLLHCPVRDARSGAAAWSHPETLQSNVFAK